MNPKAIITFFIAAAFSLNFYFVPKPETNVNDHRSGLYYTDDMTVPYRDKVSYDNYVYQLVPPPSDTIPYLSGYMDYATNGNTLKQLILLGDTIIASATYVDSLGASNPNNSNSLRVVYNYSVNNGSSWQIPGLNPVSFNSKSRYGDASTYTSTNGRSVWFAGRYWNTPINSGERRSGVSYDTQLGGSFFTINKMEYTTGYDMAASLRIDNKAACLVKTPTSTFADYDTLYYTTYTPNVSNSFSPLKKIRDAYMDNSACSYTIAASPIDTNHITIVYNYINDHLPFTKAITKVQISTNSGSNWSTPYQINPIGIINGDSAGCYWHEDIVYKPGTNDPYIVFSADGSGVELDSYRKGFKICVWSPNLNGGEPVVIADWHNIPVLMDNNSFYKIRKFHVNSKVLNHPSIGFKADGSRMFAAFSVCQVDTSSLGFTYEDIFYSYSDNGGLNWTTPVNMTNSVNAVEKYPIVPKTFPGNLPPVMYQWDQVPGCQSFNDNAPVNRVYWVLKKDILVSSGVNNANMPRSFFLHQNYPNPFNPSTKIRFEIPAGVFDVAGLRVYDLLGREVRTLVNENLKPGVYEADFNAADLPSGVYFYKLNAGEFSETKRMILIK